MIRELASRQGSPVMTSFYLDIDGRSFPRASSLVPKIDHLFQIARADASLAGAEVLQAVNDDLSQISSWLSSGVDRSQTRGVAAFSCSSEQFFSTVELPVSVPDMVCLSHRPHVAPLLIAHEALKPLLVVLVDHESARLCRIEQDRVTETVGPVDEIPRQIDDEVGIGGFSHYREEAIRRHLRKVSEALAAEMRHWPTDYVLIGGPSSRDLARALPDGIAAKVNGTISVAMTAPQSDISEIARRQLEDLERQRKESLVQMLLSRAGTSATMGIANTLESLAARRVDTLFVNEGISSGGVRCRVCGRLDVDIERCPRCGGAMDEIPDLVDAAIDEALSEGAGIEFVNIPEIQAAGGLAAIERY